MTLRRPLRESRWMAVLFASFIILVKTISISLSLLMIISRFSVFEMGGGWEIFVLLEFCSRGKFSELKVGLNWMETGLIGLAILDWLAALATSAKDVPSLTVLEAIEFCTGAVFS